MWEGVESGLPNDVPLSQPRLGHVDQPTKTRHRLNGTIPVSSYHCMQTWILGYLHRGAVVDCQNLDLIEKLGGRTIHDDGPLLPKDHVRIRMTH